MTKQELLIKLETERLENILFDNKDFTKKEFVLELLKDEISTYIELHQRFPDFIKSLDDMIETISKIELFDYKDLMYCKLIQKMLKIPFVAQYEKHDYDGTTWSETSFNAEILLNKLKKSQDGTWDNYRQEGKGYIDFSPIGIYEVVKQNNKEIAIISNSNYLEFEIRIKDESELSKVHEYLEILSKSYRTSCCDLSVPFKRIVEDFKTIEEEHENVQNGYLVSHYCHVSDDENHLRYSSYRGTFNVFINRDLDNSFGVKFQLKNIKENILKLTVFKNFLMLETDLNIKCKNLLLLDDKKSLIKFLN